MRPIIFLSIFSIIISLSFLSCEENTFTECAFDNLCDSSLQCSFELNGKNYDYEQLLTTYTYFNFWLDNDSLLQKGFLIGPSITTIGNQENSSFDFSIQKEFLPDEVFCAKSSSGFFIDSIQYHYISISNEEFLTIFSDTIFQCKYYQIKKSNADDYDNELYYYDDTTFIDAQTAGMEIHFNYQNQNYSTRPSKYLENVPPIDNYCVVKSIWHYKDNYFIIEGEFNATLFTDNYFSPETVQINNGKFKFLISSNKN